MDTQSYPTFFSGDIIIWPKLIFNSSETYHCKMIYNIAHDTTVWQTPPQVLSTSYVMVILLQNTHNPPKEFFYDGDPLVILSTLRVGFLVNRKGCFYMI